MNTSSKRYGDCEKKHALVTIKNAIGSWAKEKESFDGITRSKKEIEEIVADMIKNLTDYQACNWIACERE